MLTMSAKRATLLIVDFQARLMPAIDQGEVVLANARKLLDAAAILDVPVHLTEQNAKGLGPTVAALAPSDPARVQHKMSFDAVRAGGLLERTPKNRAVVVAGCEAHVCVLQTCLGLIDAGRKIYLVRDAVGSRRAESKETAIKRLEKHGAEIVTTEMVLFEWIETAEHPRFREVLKLVKS
jgi:nicotinamidase-related amidase